MEPRLNLLEKGKNAFKAMYGLTAFLNKSTIERPLLNLLYQRVSQINGCAFCLDMHSKDLLAEGENPQRLFCLDAWHEAPFYSKRERAALAWAEAVTNLSAGRVSDEIFEEASSQFTEEELIDLTVAVNTINSYNRFNIAFRTRAGAYQPGQFETAH